MVAVHFLYDLTELFGLVTWQLPKGIRILADLGGKVFLVLSGVCATLGHHPVRRGLQVLGCGAAVSAVTFLLWKWEFGNVLIHFGVLHCLGSSMLLWVLFRHCRRWVLFIWAAVLILAGSPVQTLSPVDTLLLIPFGITPGNFVTGDYYPLLPGLGYFLAGSWLGRLLYREKKSLFSVRWGKFSAALCWVGQRSLPIYLLHQPVLTGILFCVQLWN